ncbi:MAG: cell wall metabolism sensor histidine kinase WalK [Kiritimatiellaeota bacterium]|nr:cell wall metabolism sensor histidine kinase WalK [Kiritimatiellota bacterium]
MKPPNDKRPRRLSTRLLAAYTLLVLICVAFVGIPLHVLLRRDYVSRAAEVFGDEVDRLQPDLRRAAERGDRLALDLLCERLNMGFNGRVSILTRDGRVMGDSISARCAERASPECLAVIRTHRDKLIAGNLPVKDTVTVQVPLSLGGSAPATARLALPLAPVRMQLRDLRTLLLVCGVAAVVVALIMGVTTSRRIARPIERMTALAERIAEGDFDGSVVVDRPDEIGRLAEALDRMRRELRQNLDQISRERNQALAIVGSMADGVLAFDSGARVLFANDAAAELLNMRTPPASGVELKALPLRDELLSAVVRVRASGAAESLEFGRVEAGERVVRVTVSPVRAENDQSGERGVVLVLRDMTEARRTARMGRELVANASHELRTPLAIVASTAETLLDGSAGTDSARREFLEIIAHHAARMQRLVDETLQLSRLDGLAGAAEFEDVPVYELVAEAAEQVSSQARARGQRIELRVSDDLPPISCLPNFLVQALRNLLDNAVRYSPKGERILLSAGLTEDGSIEFRVRDSGPGVPPAEQKSILERFVRGRHGEKANPEGTGLGLAIVERVARLHGGSIRLANVPGGGACFVLSLPCDPGDDSEVTDASAG